MCMYINEEREIPGRQKVVRGSNVQVLTLHTGLNPRPCTALSLTASFVSGKSRLATNRNSELSKEALQLLFFVSKDKKHIKNDKNKNKFHYERKMNMNDKNKKDETLWSILSDIENTDIATLRKHKAKIAIPLRIGGIIFIAYMIAIVIMRYMLQMQIPSDVLWIAEVMYIAIALIIPFCVKHQDEVIQEESRMMTLLMFSGSLAVIALMVVL